MMAIKFYNVPNYFRRHKRSSLLFSLFIFCFKNIKEIVVTLLFYMEITAIEYVLGNLATTQIEKKLSL